MFKGQAASQNMAQAIALAARVASMATVQGRAALSTYIASDPRDRMLAPTISF